MILLLMISKLIIDVKRIKGYGATDIEILAKTEINIALTTTECVTLYECKYFKGDIKGSSKIYSEPKYSLNF